MFALEVETMVFIAFHARCTDLCGSVTGVASILPFVAIQITFKATSLIVKCPGDQIRREAFQTRSRVRALPTP